MRIIQNYSLYNLYRYNAEAFLELGIAGAALLIVLIVVVCIFAQQTKNITKLVGRIDDLISTSAESNKALAEVLISNDKDQKQVIHLLNAVQSDMKDIQKRVTRIDTRLYDKYKNLQNETTKDSGKVGET